ncbi:MAG TPA: hypothetical protein VGL86_18340 [Polyangia bacterium]|jgi:hypothetical protein
MVARRGHVPSGPDEDTLVSFARNRHCLTTEEQSSGDAHMLAAERTAWINVWAADVLSLADAGRFADAVALWLKGPRQIQMNDSVNVSYARLRHGAPSVVQRLFDVAFVATQYVSAVRLREFEERKRALVTEWRAWWSPTIARGRDDHA